MSFRVSALVAVVAVFGAAELTPVCAQPQAPVRPRYSTFNSIFNPYRGPVGGFGFGQNQPFVNPIGPQVAGVVVPQAFAYPGLATLPQALPGAYGTIDPQLPPTGIVGTFNNYGHWYPNGLAGGAGGYYGHWYPNGVANGRGVLGYGGGTGGGYAGTPVIAGGVRPSGSFLGTALTAGATINQFRR